nr:transposase (putative), gypsy type [Tanacetum cinerariifolium]
MVSVIYNHYTSKDFGYADRINSDDLKHEVADWEKDKTIKRLSWRMVSVIYNHYTSKDFGYADRINSDDLKHEVAGSFTYRWAKRSLVVLDPKALLGLDLVPNKVMRMISCTNENKPLALPWGRTSRLDSDERSGTLVGQGSAVIVTADTDSLPRMSADLRMACGNSLRLSRLGFKLFYSNMGTIDSMKSVLIQSTLDTLCEKYHIPDVIHPQLPVRNDRIQNSPSDVLAYFQMKLSQLSVIAAAKISHFEILCRVYSFERINDHFFWVDAFALPLAILWHKNKTLNKDPPPLPTEYNAYVCDYLASNPASFKKFSKPFLCFVGITCYYTLDEDCYPTYLDDEDQEMDLFAFIHHVDPTKVKMGEREVRECEVSLLELTRGRVIPLAGVNDQGGAAAQIVDVEAHALVADKPKKFRKRKTTDGASGSGHPSKRLREDHGTSWDASVNVTRKYLAALQDLLDKSTLAAKIVSQSQLPYPLSPLLLPPHQSMRVVDDEVSLVVRLTVPDPAVLTTSIAITVAASTFVSLPEGVNEPTRASIFADSTYVVNVGPDVVGPSQPVGKDISSKSFYVSLDIDYETLHLTYVTKWDVLNESVLDKSNVCRSLVDQLAPHLFFSQLHAMEYDQLFTKFNERDTEIAGLKAQLSLKEAEVTEAIHLHSQIMNIEGVVTTWTGELESLKERNVSLESVVIAKDFEIVSELKATCFGLFDEVAGYKLFKEQVEVVLDELVKELSDRIAGIDDDLMNPMLHMDEEFYPRYLRTIFGRRWILNRDLKLMIMKCMQSPEYLAALGGALGHAIDKGMQGGLAAGVDHRKAGRGLEEITAYDPSAKANFVFAINALRDLMVPIHRLEDQVIIGETSMSFALDVAHSRVQRLKRNVAACRLSLTDAMVSLLEPLSAKSLTSEASTSVILETAVTAALSTTFVKPTLSIWNHLLKFLLPRGLCLNKSYILR